MQRLGRVLTSPAPSYQSNLPPVPPSPSYHVITPPGNTPDLLPTTPEEPISPFDEAVETLISHNIAMALEEAEREQHEMLQTPTPDGPQPDVHPGVEWIPN
jgi:hypothetical protein